MVAEVVAHTVLLLRVQQDQVVRVEVKAAIPQEAVFLQVREYIQDLLL